VRHDGADGAWKPALCGGDLAKRVLDFGVEVAQASET
jgi:hypothetical protein